MNPEEFARRMRQIESLYGDDPEACHVLMDELMCHVLQMNGYWEGVSIFESVEKYYS